LIFPVDGNKLTAQSLVQADGKEGEPPEMMRKFSFLIFQLLVIGVVVFFCLQSDAAPRWSFAPLALGIWIAFLLTVAIVKIQEWLKYRRHNRPPVYWPEG
jgi:peptidoglycan/LPS O-acetylase OafA/YrhL